MTTDTAPVTATTTTVIVADEVTTAKQQEACNAVIAGIKKLTGRMLKDYWSVGKIIEDVISAENPDKYGDNAIKHVAAGCKHSPAALYEMNKVFKAYSEDQIELLTDAGLGITNVSEAAKIVDTDKRMTLLLEAAKAETTVKAFKEEVTKVAESKENLKALEALAKDGKKGGGARTGSGREGSPITPVKQAGALCEKIVSTFGDVIIALKEFDAQSDKQQAAMVDAAEFAAGVISDAIKVAIGGAEVIEEYLAVNQGDGRRRRGQSGRKDAYAGAAALLQDFVKGYDKTLASAEKVRKELDEQAANEELEKKAEKEKAKESIRAKAKAKAEKPAKAEKAEKPAKAVKAAASPLADRLAALRARALKAKK